MIIENEIINITRDQINKEKSNTKILRDFQLIIRFYFLGLSTL